MRVVLFILKCIVGLFASIGFLLVIGLGAIGFFFDEAESFQAEKTVVPEAAVLSLDLSAGLTEKPSADFFGLPGFNGSYVLPDVVQALEAAGDDSRVKGLLLRVGWGELGLAQIQELRDAIGAFRAKDKFAVAFAESFGEGGNGTLHYYLASAAGEIWMQPSGDLDLVGFALESPYLRGALDRIGVTPQMAQREEFKGAMNNLTDTSLPEPQRRNLQRLLDSWFEQLSQGVAQGRKLAAGRRAQTLSTRGLTWPTTVSNWA